ncbi:hypothetical protein [Chryseobacterium arthrosphaerae]|uniref:hypothetical protein n=1 Tax=Chryseobacterium arthrosphaerae TaxID=651561 RepID=UPI00241C9193|nr:hypothetical protein [Chryseobacterium arthrosphaerae]
MRIIIYIIIISFFLQACNKNGEILHENHAAVKTDTTKINGALLELIDNNGIGELRITSDQYKFSGKIKIKPPCYFLRNNGKVTIYAYPEFNIDKTIVILGGTKKDSLNKISGTEIQGILFKKDSIITAGVVKNYSPINKDTGIDEKDYWGFASGMYKN